MRVVVRVVNDRSRVRARVRVSGRASVAARSRVLKTAARLAKNDYHRGGGYRSQVVQLVCAPRKRLILFSYLARLTVRGSNIFE